MNVTLQILDMVLYQDSISHTRICRVIQLTVARLETQFFSNSILKNVKKNQKSHMEYEKSKNSFKIKKL